MKSRTTLINSGQAQNLAPSDTVVNTVFNATTGALNAMGAITAGTLYTTGTYPNVPLTGGTGFGATANITVASGGVTVVTIVKAGFGYTAADSLSALAANVGGTGSGFHIAVTSVFAGVNSVPVPAGAATVLVTGSAATWVSLTSTLPLATATAATANVLIPAGVSRLFCVIGVSNVNLAAAATNYASLEYFAD